MLRLGVNIDHVATVRNARGTTYPDIIAAALIAEENGADVITVHLREDRRHINDDDLDELRRVITTQLNLEMAATQEMVAISLKVKPDFVCLVPEKREEVTTEGGLEVANNFAVIDHIVKTLQQNGILVSLFIDVNQEQVVAAHKTGCYSIEFHTGKYANADGALLQQAELENIQAMSKFAVGLGLIVNAGHGLNYVNVKPVARIKELHELNIGHAIVGQSIFDGLAKAVGDMKNLMKEACNE